MLKLFKNMRRKEALMALICLVSSSDRSTLTCGFRTT